jgi:peroxiredoxin Q/BCP
VKSHQGFREKKELQVTLLSDPEKELTTQVGAWGEKKLYGKVTTGVIRSTFLVDPQGVVSQSWTKVKAKGHADIVYASLEELQKSVGARKQALK